jgi:hypothetical protein
LAPRYRQPFPIRSYQEPGHPTALINLRKDSRGQFTPFAPDGQPDQAAQTALRVALARNGIVDIGEYLDRLVAKYTPPQLAQSTFLAVITGNTSLPQLLIPKNSIRQSFKAVNWQTPGGTVYLSYGRPKRVNNQYAGIPLLANSLPYEEPSGTISTNDLWVSVNDAANTNTYPIVVLGYEGALSIAGNRP